MKGVKIRLVHVIHVNARKIIYANVVMNNNHLKERDVGYFKHLKNALKEAIRCEVALFLLVIHSVFPFFFGDYFSKYINETQKRVNPRSAWGDTTIDME